MKCKGKQRNGDMAMKKKTESETKNPETTNPSESNHIELDSTDLDTLLGRIAKRVAKEGASLEAIADKWLGDGETKSAIKQIGIDCPSGEKNYQFCATKFAKPAG
jgi:hypothetical protein